VQVARHRPYYPDVPIDEALRETYERCLVPGAMFFLRTRLCIVPDTAMFAQEPHPYVYESLYGGDAVAGNKGNVAIYAGQVRVEESTGKSLIRVPRHSFIINGGRGWQVPPVQPKHAGTGHLSAPGRVLRGQDRVTYGRPTKSSPKGTWVTPGN